MKKTILFLITLICSVIIVADLGSEDTTYVYEQNEVSLVSVAGEKINIIDVNESFVNFDDFDPAEGDFFYYDLKSKSSETPIVKIIIRHEDKTYEKEYYIDESNRSKSLESLVSDYYKEVKETILIDKTAFFESLFEKEIIFDLLSDEPVWTLNPSVYEKQKEMGEFGKFVVKLNTYEQIVRNHYFTRVETVSEFIPGIAASNAGLSGYKNWSIDQDGTQQKTRVTRISNDFSEPKGIDYWPRNGSYEYTVSSGWGLGLELGYSQKDKFQGNIIGSYNRSTSYTKTSPNLDAMTTDVGKEYSWVYKKHSSAKNHTVTQHTSNNVLVEQKQDAKNGVQGRFLVNISMKMTVDRSIFYKKQELIWNVPEFIVGGSLNHQHLFNDDHEYFNERQHSSKCFCGETILRPHLVSSDWNGMGYTKCLDCGANVNFGVVISRKEIYNRI